MSEIMFSILMPFMHLEMDVRMAIRATITLLLLNLADLLHLSNKEVYILMHFFSFFFCGTLMIKCS